jgi:Putative Actinobacterial Holin-X, holin superfamily III
MATISSPTAPPPDSTAIPPESQSTLALVRRLLDELSVLFRQEVRLAIAEVSSALGSLTIGATSIAAAAAMLFGGLLVLLAAAVLGLSLALPAWLAALLVGLVVIGAGIVALRIGNARFHAGALKPARSARSLLKDKDVLTRKNK